MKMSRKFLVGFAYFFSMEMQNYYKTMNVGCGEWNLFDNCITNIKGAIPLNSLVSLYLSRG